MFRSLYRKRIMKKVALIVLAVALIAASGLMTGLASAQMARNADTRMLPMAAAEETGDGYVLIADEGVPMAAFGDAESPCVIHWFLGLTAVFAEVGFLIVEGRERAACRELKKELAEGAGK